MITAHLPSGYVLGRTAQRYGVHPWLMTAALVGAMLPDFDLIWFNLIDDRALPHHQYWLHVPGFWLVVMLVTMLALRRWRPWWLPPARAFFAAIFLHLFLDTVAGDIAWGWPFTDRLFNLFAVPAAQNDFILQLIFHWTFSFELMIWALALYLYAKAKL
jgi:inner membrane protein